MKDTISTNHELIRVTVNSKTPSITLESDWIFIIVIVAIIIILFLIKKLVEKNYKWQNLEVEISGTPKIVYKVERNYENLYIANRIYIELTTRKAAILIDENKDNIDEIYKSWYSLFGIIRDEIKTVPGKYLKNHDSTKALIGLSRKILNEVLRPHLTEFQAKYRKWYEIENEKPENKILTPQEIQKKFPEFTELINSMKSVNLILIDYANELDKLIKGK